MSSRLLNKVAIVTASTEGCVFSLIIKFKKKKLNLILDFCFNFRIGFSIARRLAQEGAKVVISSRKQAKVDKALDALQKEELEVHGLVCHVGKESDRKRLIEEVILI